MSRPVIEEPRLAAVLSEYPLGTLVGIVRNGLSVNTAACLFETPRGRFFAKAYDPLQREPMGILAEHSLAWELLAHDVPTPRLHLNRAGTTLTWHQGLGYVIADLARGEDRYGAIGVFEPFGHPEEIRSAGAMLARFHLALAEGPPLGPKAFRGLTARYELMRSPGVREGLEALWAEAPAIEALVGDRPDWPWLVGFLEARHGELAAHLRAMPRGLIHGDFIKRNLFWQGHEVSEIIDFDLWNEGYWAYDLALALLPCGFDWPRLLQGQGEVRRRDLESFVAGYRGVRPLHEAERAALPALLETARCEFYLGAIATMLERGDGPQAERFYALLVGTARWFDAHPGWARGLEW